ncbi:MAG: arginase [Alphaproteobacteria bacterium]
MANEWNIIGVGSGWGAQDMGTARGPEVLMNNCPTIFRSIPSFMSYWHDTPLSFSNPLPLSNSQMLIYLNHLLKILTWLSNSTENVSLKKNIPLIFGGDHSIAIGTWKGIKAAFPNEDIGLIWIDAHMDAHTPNTSPSLNFHGMPLAVLLGYGDPSLTNLKFIGPAIKAKHTFLIGTRSYEEDEALLLKYLGVKIYHIKEVKSRGFHTVFNEALSLLSDQKFGISIDVDGFDPQEAPGTGMPVSYGLKIKEVITSLHGIFNNPSFIGLEIVEYNPYKDRNSVTCQLIWELVNLINGR